jgi:serine/threonine protein kinase/Tol biopolymer transport system component
MSTDRWQLLSEWHNAWLVAGADARNSLRRQFVEDHPDLAAQADALASASAGLCGFLETPALALAARDLAQDDPLLGVDTLVGPYRIVGLMARGGMGDVYRATDVRLQRDVALKLLAHAGRDDTQRIERFLQEARVTAALDHANIVKVFDVGVLDGRPYLVAELLDGETLRVRLGRGPLAVEEAARIAGDVAAGLVVAHAAGLVHRDLKPDNVFLTRAGVTKILDFGIAKLTDGPAVADGLATLTGVLLGTAGYLAPEQIRGIAVDGRTDLFALGSMLFEMSTGQRAFAREHTIDTLHAILHDDPPNLLQAAGVSPDFTAIVMRLLEKAPAARFQSAADLERALVHIARTPAAPSVPKTSARRLVTDRLPRLRGRAVAAIAAVVAIGLAGIGSGVWSRPVADVRPMPVRFSVSPPPGNRFQGDVERTHLAFSPDGANLAFIAGVAGGVPRIWLRSVAGVEPLPLTGTEGASSLFWSPDSRSLAFFAGNKLKRLDLPDGAVVPLYDVAEMIGLTGTWGADGEILFASVEGDTIMSVSTSGGTPTTLVTPDRARGEVRVNWPWFLPDGRRFLYLSRLGDGSGQLVLGERGRPSRVLLSAVSNVQWVDPNYLVFARDGMLVGQRFDLATARVVGELFSIAERIDYNYSTARAEFATSRTGNVAYKSHTDTARLTWSDRRGAMTGDVGTPGNYQTVRLSPDGGRVLFDRRAPRIGTMDLWVLDLVRGGETRLTSDVTSESWPVWLQDGVDVVFVADRAGPPHLFRRHAVTGAENALLPAGRHQKAADVSPDGKTLAFEQRTPLGNYDILTLSLEAPGAPSVLLDSRFDEIQLRFSPDGRAVAFVLNESGPYEVYVAPFPAMTPKLRVSAGGGRSPRWNPAGRELFYLANDGHLAAVRIRTTPVLELGSSATLFAVTERASWGDFAVSPDGQRFLSISYESRGSEQPITVVLNWPAETTR